MGEAFIVETYRQGTQAGKYCLCGLHEVWDVIENGVPRDSVDTTVRTIRCPCTNGKTFSGATGECKQRLQVSVSSVVQLLNGGFVSHFPT